jgi:hypothetical protein
VLGEKYAPKGEEAAVINTDTLENAKVKNPDAIARENQDSLNNDR